MGIPEIILPDFDEWADNALSEGDPSWLSEMDFRIQDTIALALKQAFEQGYNLGLNRGWQIEQDKDYADKEGGKA